MLPEVVVGKYALLRFPQVAMNRRIPHLRTLAPARRFRALPEKEGNMLQVALVAVEQAIQTNRREVMRRSAKRAEAKARIEPRLAHRAIAKIEVLRQAVAVGIGVHADDADLDIAACLLQPCGLGVVGMLATLHEVLCTGLASADCFRMCNDP